MNLGRGPYRAAVMGRGVKEAFPDQLPRRSCCSDVDALSVSFLAPSRLRLPKNDDCASPLDASGRVIRSLGECAGRLVEAEDDAPPLGAGWGVSHVREVPVRTVNRTTSISRVALGLVARCIKITNGAAGAHDI